MAKLYDNLVAPEWRIAITPSTLADDTLRGLRTVTGNIAATTELTLATDSIRPFYGMVKIDLEDIEYVNALATNTEAVIVAGELKAGELSGKQFLGLPNRVGKYRFKSDILNIDAFGLGITDYIALVGRDFSYFDGHYWFNEDPAKFGSIGVDGAKQVLTLPCMGGELSNAQLPLGIAYRQCSDYTTMSAIQEAVYGNAPNGITNALIYAIGGIRVSNAKITQCWTEENYYIGIDERGELVYAPIASGVVLNVGEKADTKKLNAPLNYILVPTSLGNYVILLNETNKITDCPGISKDFPQITQDFMGWELFMLLRQLGCVFYTFTYINNNAGAQKALSNFVTNYGKTIITTTAKATTTVVFNGEIELPNYTVVATNTAGTTNII